MVLALVLAALSAAQDPPKITLTKEGKLSEVVAELAPLVGPIGIDPKVDDNPVALPVSDAGYFEVLDAICRSHGNLRYFSNAHQWLSGRKGAQFLLGTPLPYPSTTEGHFKFLVTRMGRVQSRSVEGDGAWVTVELALLAPPFVRITRDSGGSVRWKLLAAKDTDGRDVLEPRGSTVEQISLRATADFEGNISDRSFMLGDFDPAKGLSLLRGETKITSVTSKDIRVAWDLGKETEVPGGKLVVDGEQEYEPNKWRLTLTFKPEDPKATLRKTLDAVATTDLSPGRSYLNFPSKGLSFEVDAGLTPGKPAWVGLRFRTGDRSVVVPFEFKNVRF